MAWGLGLSVSTAVAVAESFTEGDNGVLTPRAGSNLRWGEAVWLIQTLREGL